MDGAETLMARRPDKKRLALRHGSRLVSGKPQLYPTAGPYENTVRDHAGTIGVGGGGSLQDALVSYLAIL